MVGQHDHSRITDRREVAERPGTVRVRGVAVTQGGGVAMMAVRDVGLARGEGVLEPLYRRYVRDGEDAMVDAGIVDVGEGRSAGGERPQLVGDLVIGVADHQKD